MELPIAGLGTRSYAFLIDWHIRLLIALCWVIFIMVLFAQSGLDYTIDNQTFVFTASIPAGLVYIIYQPLVEIVMRGSSPGKRMAKVIVVDLAGHTPTVAALVIRNIVRILDSLPLFYTVGIVCCLVTERHVRFGDLIAQTLLIYLPEEEEVDVESDTRFANHNKLNVQQITIIRGLLSRWDELDKQNRVALARKLLSKLGRSVTTDNEGELLKMLEELLS